MGIPRPNLKWNQRTVTVSLEKDAVQVVIFRGKRITKWGTASLSGEPGSTDPEDPSRGQDDPESRLQNVLNELGIRRRGKLGKLLDKIGVRRGRVVMDLSLYTTLMRHLQIPRVRGRYLEPVVVSEVLDSLPFSKDEVDIAWQLQKGEEGQSVFAVALPKERADAQVKFVREAGLIPEAAYSKASALALSSGIGNGILVHLTASETALVLVHGGEPKVVHQLEFGSVGPSPEEHAVSLVRAIEQVAGYFQPLDTAEQSLGPALPVILTGQSSKNVPVIQSLGRILRRQVLTIAPPIRYPEEFPLGEYATNVGLFLADRVGNAMEASGPSGGTNPLNLLPRRHRPRPVPVFQASIFVILILLAVHPYNVTDRVDAKIQERDAIAEELQSLRRQERRHDVLLTSYQESNAELESAREFNAKLETQLETLQADIDLLLARLSTMTDSALPPGVELSSVAPLGREFSVVGIASSHAEALRYAANLRDSPLLEEARIVRVEGPGGANPHAISTVSFQIRVAVPLEKNPEPEDGETDETQ